MPMPMPVPGQAPGAVPPQPNAGAATVPQGNQGNQVQALSLVRNGLEMFQKAISMIPMGAPLHADLLKAISTVSKHMEHNDANKGVDIQSLLQIARQASQQSPVQALNRMNPAPNAPPAMPTPPTPPAAA
jgi:hypothetical protein